VEHRLFRAFHAITHNKVRIVSDRFEVNVAEFMGKVRRSVLPKMNIQRVLCVLYPAFVGKRRIRYVIILEPLFTRAKA
jgi:hypothetical protein